MPAKKKSSSSLKMKVFVVLIIVALVASSAGMLFSGVSNVLPSVTLFQPEGWMGFIPGGVISIRFLNYSDIRDLANILPDKNKLYLYEINYNLTVFDINYELDVGTSDANVLVYNLNSTVANQISEAYSASSQTSQLFNGVPMYLINASDALGTAWIAVYNRTVIYTEGNETAWAGVAEIINATNDPLFSNDSLKIGLLLASNLKPFFAMYYFKDADPSLQMDWAIVCLTNPVTPVAMQVFHFPTSDIAKNVYSSVASIYFSSSAKATLTQNYIYGTAQ